MAIGTFWAKRIVNSVPLIQYLNTDLDLVAPVSLAPLACALEARQVVPLHVTQGDDGQWYATLETDEQFNDPEHSIARMLDAIESLPDHARALWDKCTKRDFNIGYDCGVEPWAFSQGLAKHTLRRLAATGASVSITLYPYTDDSTTRNSENV